MGCDQGTHRGKKQHKCFYSNVIVFIQVSTWNVLEPELVVDEAHVSTRWQQKTIRGQTQS